jgi:hemoglobin-like flavoprotein
MRRLRSRFYPSAAVVHRKWRAKETSRSLSLRHALRALGSSPGALRGRPRKDERPAPKAGGGNIVNAEQQELVRTTFAALAVMPEVAGALFYERLFAANPSFRPLFKNDMRIQGVKLMTMLAMVVYNLPEPGQVLPEIRDLAVRHVGYGVKLADYDAMREALLWTLEQALGEGATPAVREAWTVCYDELAGEMKAAAGL